MDIGKFFLEKQFDLAMLSAGMTARAESYRDYRVGSAFLTECKGEIRLIGGSNYKPGPDEHKKWCAEMDALKKAVEKGLTKILAVTVMAEPQVYNGTKIKYRTQHTCEHCLHIFDLNRELFFPETIFWFIDRFNNKGNQEFFTFESIMDLHKDHLVKFREKKLSQAGTLFKFPSTIALN